MDDEIRDYLRTYIAEHGTSFCDDPRQVRALLEDLAGDQHRREIAVLEAAALERVPAELLAAAGDVRLAATVDRLARALHDNRGLDRDAARWAVTTWAAAFGLAGPSPSEPSHAKPATPDQPPATVPAATVRGLGLPRQVPATEPQRAAPPRLALPLKPVVPAPATRRPAPIHIVSPLKPVVPRPRAAQTSPLAPLIRVYPPGSTVGPAHIPRRLLILAGLGILVVVAVIFIVAAVVRA